MAPLHPLRYVLAEMLKLKARDADKVVVLHDVVGGFQPLLDEGAFEAMDPVERRVLVGYVSE